MRPSPSARPSAGRNRSNTRFRRGAMGAALAIGAVAVLGMGALATEGGLWLTQRRGAQSAADAAAYAGAIVLQQRGTSTVIDVARQVATRNGFTGGTGTTVDVEIGLWNGSAFSTELGSSTANAVRVNITQTQFMGLMQLIGTTAPAAWGGAIAAVQTAGRACTLSLTGITNIGGDNNTFAPGCVIASNNGGDKSVWLRGNADVTADGVVTLGTCAGCAGHETDPDRNFNFVRAGIRTTDPFAAVVPHVNSALQSFHQDWASANNQGRNTICAQGAPTYTGGNRSNYTSATLANARMASLASGSIRVVCEAVSVGNGQTLTLTAGVYVFYRSGNGPDRAGDLSIANGGTIQCSDCTPGGEGVTLIFTGVDGDDIATFNSTGGTFNLNAPGNDPSNPLEGLLMYRDARNTETTGGRSTLKITGNGTSSVFGGIYAPTSEVEMTGTSALNMAPSGVTVPGPGGTLVPVGCSPIVAAAIKLNGTSGVDIRGCNGLNVDTSQLQFVELVQ